MSIRRSQLFGTTTHVPQGRVLTAEEMYGAVPQGHVLTAEEAYGTLQPQGRVLTAEESYGGGYSWYGMDDEYDFDDDDILDDEEAYVDDIDDDDLEEEEEMALFGGDPEAELEAALTELDEELDADLKFGAMYGRMSGPLRPPPGTEAYVQEVANALSVGAFMPNWAQSGLPSYILEVPSEYINSVVTGRETREIAIYLMREPGFAQWNTLSDAQKAAMVQNAVYSAAVPGIEMQADDPIRQAFASGSVWQRVMANPRAVYNFWTGDFPRLVGTLAGITDDQLINGTAIRYLALGYAMPQVYTWLANEVTKEAQSAISAVGEATTIQDLGPVMGPAPVAGPMVQPPPQVLPAGSGWPTPAQIIGIGTGIAVGGAMLGIFRN